MRIRKLLRTSRRGSAAVDDDIDAEIRSHLAERVQLLIGQGMTPEEARDVAGRRFGNLEATRQSMRRSARRHEARIRWRDRLDAMIQDGRYAIRQLSRTPGFTVAVTLTFALGIGANATMFGVVDRLLLRPPAHVREPDRLGRVYLTWPGQDGQEVESNEVSYRRFIELRDAAHSVVDLAAMSPSELAVGTGTDARKVPVSFATGNFWSLLGVRPALGRLFTEDEDRPPDGTAVVVLGNSYWRSAFAGDSGILGRQLQIGARRYEIVGVAPEGFNGVTLARVDAWIPATTIRTDFTSLEADWHTKHGLQWLRVVGRLQQGAAREQASAALTAGLARSVRLENPSNRITASLRADFGPLLEERGPERSTGARVATLLAAVAAVVLLVACANVANLLLARALRRRREIAVRVAIGISRPRLVMQLLMESLLLAGTGALLGLGLARAGGRVMEAELLPNVAWGEQLLDLRVLAFTALATLTAGVLAGLAPALYATRPDLAYMLKGTVREGGAHPRARARTALLLAQAALSTMLLIGAGLFVKSLRNAQSTNLGLDAARLLTVQLELRDAPRPPGGRVVLYRQFAERLRALPGVIQATTTLQIPFSMYGSTDIDVPGVDSAARLGRFLINGVGEHYFETVGTRILRGRALGTGDRAGSPLVMVVSDSMARTLWPRQEALGKCVKVGGRDRPCSEVVGIAENVHQDDIRGEPYLQYWFPESQNQGDNSGAFATLVRVVGDPVAMTPTIRRALQPLAPGNSFVDVRPLRRAVDRVVRPWRLGATMFGTFGLLGLTIAAMGLYSLLAYAVSQRTQELGVRVALGARTADLLQLVIGQGLRVTAIGMALGVAAALAASRWAASLLFEVKPTDLSVLGVVVGTLLCSALAASLVPAWRAARVDPVEALRAE